MKPRINARSARRILAGIAPAALIVTCLSWQQPAVAGSIALNGSAAATQINLLDGTVVSGPTSSSELQTSEVGKSVSNTLATVDVTGVLKASTLSSDVTTDAVGGGVRVTSTAKAAGVNLLNGAIKLDAVTTTSSVSVVDGVASYTGETELLGLTVNKRKIPINVKPNTTITIPGLAEVILNQTSGKFISDAHASVDSAGIKVTLLKPVKNLPAGATILVTPTSAGAGPNIASEGPVLAGGGYALKASVNAGDTVKVIAGPVAGQYLPIGGTGGQEVERSTVGVNVPFAAKASVLGTSVQGSRKPTASSGTVYAHAAKVNLFAGKIVVEAVEATATASRNAGAAQPTLSGSTTLVGLRLGGKRIPVNTAPNTQIDVAGIGTVTINQQIPTGNGLIVRGLDIKIDTKGLGLPIGAEVELAGAYAAVSK